ncbi:extensin-like protein [Nitrobacter winogradskyi Nb-255]|uniref:Extensin-like protein n=1 Tax=Nitrobacter winogradskyi (strain ATCC 25391 / DSM 10237 / CIP 104748 / NCIMB 11846 / Nb-255) TaxID=323098 RepID=Q3SV06_NITWN|nr:extensin-like protein [Nitrobacter winogradskyi Nb-255]
MRWPSLRAFRLSQGLARAGGTDLVRLEAVVLPDRTRVPVKPAATLRCTMASAIADWVRADIAPLAERLGSRVSELDNFDSFECRGRNRVAGAKLSEHGHANALDVRSVRMSNGRTITLTDRSVPRELREKLLNSVCARFTTVLGPGSDGYHEDHIHLDLAGRRNGYRICQWKIDDPMPRVAPLLPPERPAKTSLREPAEEKNKKEKASEGVPERAAASGVASQASDDPPQLPAAVPIPQKRPLSRTEPGKVAEDAKPSPSVSRSSTRLSATRSAKRKHRPRLDLPPFLRPLFN